MDLTEYVQIIGATKIKSKKTTSSIDKYYGSYLIHSLDANHYKLVPAAIDVSADPLLKVFANPVQLFWRRHRVVHQGFHLVLDQPVLRDGRVDGVHVALVCRPTGGTATQPLGHSDLMLWL